MEVKYSNASGTRGNLNGECGASLTFCLTPLVLSIQLDKSYESLEVPIQTKIQKKIQTYFSEFGDCHRWDFCFAFPTLLAQCKIEWERQSEKLHLLPSGSYLFTGNSASPSMILKLKLQYFLCALITELVPDMLTCLCAWFLLTLFCSSWMLEKCKFYGNRALQKKSAFTCTGGE